MARKSDFEMLIHCSSCGEDYSATYKRCPFCGERGDRSAPVRDDNDDDDGYVFDGQDAFDDEPAGPSPSRPKGGKRLASGGSGRRSSAPEPINWPRLITFLCSLVIIVAALVIIFTVVYPQLHKDPVPNASLPVQVSEDPAGQSSPDPVGGASDAPDASGEPAADPGALTSLSFGRTNDYDFTLRPGETHTISLVTAPEDWSGAVTWSSSDESYATVDSNGKVTNVNTTSALHRVVITASAEGFEVTATVYCRAEAASDPSPSPSSSAPVSSNEPAPGSKGTITGADGGLRVRSGPGTSYDILASLVNGNEITIVSDAGNGWYEITFSGSAGAAITGYIMGDYISVP